MTSETKNKILNPKILTESEFQETNIKLINNTELKKLKNIVQNTNFSNNTCSTKKNTTKSKSDI